MKKFIVVLMFMLIAVVGCNNQPTVDGSSQESMKASMKVIQEGLTKEQIQEFRGSVIFIGMNSRMSGESDETLLAKIDGLDYDGIVALAADIKK